MSDQQSLQEEVLRNLSQTVTKDLDSGKRQKAIVKKLKKQGLSEETAHQLVGDLARKLDDYKRSPEGRKDYAKKYRGRMFRGLLWTIAGIVITALSYSGSSEGGTYLICWGAVLFGFIDFLVGLFGWLKNQ